MKDITITGARIHNLKEIDISLPKNKLIVATGVSGSGKSSLVFNTIFEEGRSRYLQSLGMISGISDEDKFDTITGIGPAIAVQQSIIRQSNPRSTVGSRTNLLSMLGILYAGEGQISCPTCAVPVNEDLVCSKCGLIEERLEASYFSYNAPNGMCLKCSGRGAYFEIDLEKLVPDNHTTLQAVFDSVGVTPGYLRLLRKQFEAYMEMPFSTLPDEVKENVIHGHYVDSNYSKRSYCLTRLFQGRIYRYGEDFDGIYTMGVCAACQGFRIGEEARNVLIDGKHIGELGSLSIAGLREFLLALLGRLPLTQFSKNLIEEMLRSCRKITYPFQEEDGRGLMV